MSSVPFFLSLVIAFATAFVVTRSLMPLLKRSAHGLAPESVVSAVMRFVWLAAIIGGTASGARAMVFRSGTASRPEGFGDGLLQAASMRGVEDALAQILAAAATTVSMFFWFFVLAFASHVLLQALSIDRSQKRDGGGSET